MRAATGKCSQRDVSVQAEKRIVSESDIDGCGGSLQLTQSRLEVRFSA
jgi:hypothetical protein